MLRWFYCLEKQKLSLERTPPGKKLRFCIRYLWKKKEKPANLNRGVSFSMKWKAACQNWAHLDEEKNFGLKSHLLYELLAQSPSINGPFSWCHAKLQFLVLFIKTKIHLHELIYCTGRILVTSEVSGKSITIWEPKFTKKCMLGGAASVDPCHTFLCSHISKSLQQIFLKHHRLTKFGTINRFMEMNFSFKEKHKKSQFCMTSWKRSINPFTITLKYPSPEAFWGHQSSHATLCQSKENKYY